MLDVLKAAVLAIAFAAGMSLINTDAPLRSGAGSWLGPVQARAEAQQGESYLVLEVVRQDFVQERAESLRDAVRAGLRQASVGYTGLVAQEGTVEVRITNEADLAKAREAVGAVIADKKGTDSFADFTLAEAEPGLLRLVPSEAGIDAAIDAAIRRSVEILKRRIVEFGAAKYDASLEGKDRIAITVSGSHDPDRLREVLSRRARLTLQWVDASMPAEQALAGKAPEGSSIINSNEEPPRPYLVKDEVVLSGDRIVDAQATADQYSGQPVISFRFDEEGARLFGEATAQNIGKSLAVILDGIVIMAPTVLEPILGGAGQISGNFTAESAKDAALLLRAGGLPAKFNVIEARFKTP